MCDHALLQRWPFLKQADQGFEMGLPVLKRVSGWELGHNIYTIHTVHTAYTVNTIYSILYTHVLYTHTVYIVCIL